VLNQKKVGAVNQNSLTRLVTIISVCVPYGDFYKLQLRNHMPI